MSAVKNMLEFANEVVTAHPYITGNHSEWREANIARFANRVPCSMDVAEYFIDGAINQIDKNNRSDRDGI